MAPVKPGSMPRAPLWFGVAGLIVILDRVTKALVLQSFAPGEGRAVTDFFNLVLVFNKGAAFSLLATAAGWQTFFFAAIAVIASVVVGFLILKHAGKKMFSGGLALILGGALGNLYDRLAYGHVVDFLDFHAAAMHFPAFNVADSAITVGAGILIVESFIQKQQ